MMSQLTQTGISLPFLFEKFGGLMKKAEIIRANDTVEDNEKKRGSESLITDMVSEDRVNSTINDQRFHTNPLIRAHQMA